MTSKKKAKQVYTMRSAITEGKYVDYCKTASDDCPLCDGRKVLRKFWFWEIVENHYPYDLVSDLSHILITKRHRLCWFGRGLATLELYFRVFPTLRREDFYTICLENLNRQKTVPGHAHWHILQAD
jgi:hypothetical protein